MVVAHHWLTASSVSMSTPDIEITPVSQEIIATLIRAVESKISILHILKSCPVAKWDDILAQTVLGNVITVAHSVDNHEVVSEIVEYYRIVRTDQLPVKLWIQTANLDPEVARWCRTKLKISVIDHWRMLLNLGDEELTIAVADHLSVHLPLENVDDWHQLIAMMEPNADLADPQQEPVPHHNQLLRCWLIRNQPLVDYPEQLPSVLAYGKALARFFGEGQGKTMPVVVEKHGPQNKEEVVQQMINTYAASRYLTRCKMAAVVFPEQVGSWPCYNDTPVHQRYGPVNALTTALVEVSDTPKHTPCTKYGGCRMKCCQDFEIPDEDGSVNWFTGICLQCQNPIECEELAVRLPQAQGGWKNCYCGWYCVSEYVANAEFPVHERKIIEEKIERFEIQLEYTPMI